MLKDQSLYKREMVELVETFKFLHTKKTDCSGKGQVGIYFWVTGIIYHTCES